MRDLVTEAEAVARMYSLARRLRGAARLSRLLDDALDGAIAFLEADFGNIQLVDPRTSALRIVSQRDCSAEFLDYFTIVDEDSAVCGRAAATRAQAVVADVTTDEAFAPHRAMARTAGFRAVQSTPLIDRHGTLRGVVSTHFKSPHRPPGHELRLAEDYARLIADALAAQRRARPCHASR